MELVPLKEETLESLLPLSLAMCGHMEDGSPLQAKKRAPTGNQICWYLDSGLLRLQN